MERLKYLLKFFKWHWRLNFNCWGCGPIHVGMWCEKNPKPELIKTEV